LEKIGIELTPLEELIWIENITFQTIAFNEVLKQHKDIDDEVESFYKKREKSFKFSQDYLVGLLFFIILLPKGINSKRPGLGYYFKGRLLGLKFFLNLKEVWPRLWPKNFGSRILKG